MVNEDFNDGPYLTISGTRRTMDGQLVELRESPDGYVYVSHSHRLHGPNCGHEIKHGQPWDRDQVLSAWRAAPEHPTDPLWCTNCMQVPVDETPNTQPTRQTSRIEAVGLAAAPVLEHLFGDRRSTIEPDQEVWTADVGRYVLGAVTAERDPGKGTIEQRMRTVFGDASRPATLFLAETMYLRTLPLTGSVSTQYKHEVVRHILGWLDPTPAVPAAMARGMDGAGVFNGGSGYNKGIWRHLRWFAQLVIALDARDAAERARYRTDPWALRDLLTGELADPPSIRNTFLATAFPETFEFVINDSHKRQIRDAFADRIGGASGSDPTDIDRDLATIRATETDRAKGQYVDWYAQPWKRAWFSAAPAAGQPASEGGDHPTMLPRATPELVEALFLPDSAWLDDYIALLEARKQVIVYGPPGTGKTFVARAIARHIAGISSDGTDPSTTAPAAGATDGAQALLPASDPAQIANPAPPAHPAPAATPVPASSSASTNTKPKTPETDPAPDHPGQVVVVQFHPSYAYEDFFEGLRPVTNDAGQVMFHVQPGPLRRIAEHAAAHPEHPHVLIIDEINRANIAKVFGELYYLLEYREEQVALQYSPDRPFRLPGNLYVIGTMNTADRSIALIDAAIRRRFSFIEMHPSEEPVAGLLGRSITLSDDPRPRLLRALNDAIGQDDRDLHVGPSYLMRTEADSTVGLRRVWRHDILPLLEEHYYGRYTREEVVRRFGLDAIIARAGLPPSEQVTPWAAQEEAAGARSGLTDMTGTGASSNPANDSSTDSEPAASPTAPASPAQP